MSDQWKHRSQGMRCKTCMFFVPKIPFTPIVVTVAELAERSEAPHRSFDLGRCRRHAPTLSGWPTMFVNDWCGDHKLDEEKLHLDRGRPVNLEEVAMSSGAMAPGQVTLTRKF